MPIRLKWIGMRIGMSESPCVSVLNDTVAKRRANCDSLKGARASSYMDEIEETTSRMCGVTRV